MPWKDKVECEVEPCEIRNDRGHMTRSVKVTCSKCGHSTESYGQGEGSIKRCLVLLNEECPEGEDNFYVQEDE